MTDKGIILVIEDDKGLNSLICKDLESMGFTAEGVYNGHDAIDRIRKRGVRLLLLDYKLPDITGDKVIEILAEKESNVPFIVMTGHGDDKLAVDMMRLGAKDYINKEFGFMDLLPYTVEGVINELAGPKAENKAYVPITSIKERQGAFLKSRDSFLHVFENICRKYAEPEFLFRGLLKSMANALDARCRWKEGHTERVVIHCEHIAVKMNFNADELDDLLFAATLHDLGKIGVSVPLLEKTGKFTEEEFALVRKHAILGSSMIKGIPQLRKFNSTVRSHHEKFDGSGYPDGLRGGAIPLSARILHVADSYDSMMTERPYRSSYGKKYAVSELTKHAGRQFDPDVVDVLINVIYPLPV